MPTLHSLMALYGALDRAVVESGDPETAAAVERFLPGTTGRHQGWLHGIERFLATLPGETIPFPTVRDALADIVETDDLTIPQKSKLVYVLGALDQLPTRVVGGDPLFDRALATVAPAGRPEGEGTGGALRGLLAERFTSRAEWTAVTAAAVDARLMSADVAAVPLCQTRLIEVGHRVCVEVTTHYADPTITLAEIKAVLDPANWPKLCTFFRSMSDLNPTPRTDSWSRSLERVGTTGDDMCLTTALKFFKSEVGSDEIRVDYDLDDTPGATFGDGLVHWDRGYLNVRATGERGVAVRTKKVVYIQGLPSVSMREWACISGYGAVSMEMIFGGAKHPPLHAKPWSASRPAPVPPSDAPTRDPDPAQGTDPVSAATRLATDYAKDVSARTAALADKWAAGTLTAGDMIGYGSYVGARMASEPWRMLDVLTRGRGRPRDAR